MAQQPSPPVPEAAIDAGEAAAPARARVSRRAALAMAGGLAAVLGLGWLADALAQAPLAAPLPRDTIRQVGGYRVSLTFAPSTPVAGRPVSMTAAITSAGGAPLVDARVTMRVLMVAMDMSTPWLSALPVGGGRYVTTVAVPMSGAWNAEVKVAPPGSATASADFPFSVR